MLLQHTYKNTQSKKPLVLPFPHIIRSVHICAGGKQALQTPDTVGPGGYAESRVAVVIDAVFVRTGGKETRNNVDLIKFTRQNQWHC